jgi:hypothetical protein
MTLSQLRSRKVRRILLDLRSETNKIVASGKGGKGPPKTSAEKKTDQIANGVDALKIDDTPRTTSKNLDVLKEFEQKEKKNEANFVVIGKNIYFQLKKGEAKVRRPC